MGEGLKRAVRAARATQRSHGSGLLAHIEAAERQARADGFPLVAQVLNNAKNTLGWEMSGNHEAAALAARGERSR